MIEMVALALGGWGDQGQGGEPDRHGPALVNGLEGSYLVYVTRR